VFTPGFRVHRREGNGLWFEAVRLQGKEIEVEKFVTRPESGSNTE
jgi:hypothetical protein